MCKITAVLAACVLLPVALMGPGCAAAQAGPGGPGGNPSNAVGFWGQDTGTGKPCIVAPPNGSATCVLPTTGGGGGGGGAVFGPTAVGSAAANPPVLQGGTANGSATGNVQVIKVDSAGNQQQNLTQVGGTNFAVGSTVSASSIPVVIASDQASVSVKQATAANFNATVVGTGTFATQAAQSGTWTVQPGNTANTTPWLTTDSSTVSQGSTTSGQKGGLIMGAVTTSAPSYTTGQTSALSLDVAGNLRGIIANTTFGATMASGAAASGACALGCMVDFGTGASPAANTLLNDTHVMAAAVSTATPAGTNIIGKVGIDQTTPGTTNGTTDNPLATDGVSQFSALVPNNTTSVAVDASPGTLKSVQVFNNSATIAYLKLYNAAQGSTTCGSGTPVKRIMIPANTSGAGAVISLGGRNGVFFSTAITYCVTTGIADADTTAPAASAYIVNLDYK